MNKLTKEIDKLFDVPGLTFKDIDALANSELENDKNTYKSYKILEEKYPDLFRYARKFEGNARNLGVHASGILITPVPINDYVPTRYVDGLSVTLYEGPTLEGFNFVKFDILGETNNNILFECPLYSVTSINSTLNAFNP